MTDRTSDALSDDGDASAADTGASPDDDAGLTAGAASRDVTPENGQSFFGYARPELFARGVSIRLFVHALVLSDGERKVALVGGDLGRPAVRDRVLEHARPLGFDRDTVLFAATHTHAGPNEVGDWIAARIGDAIAEADANRQPARAAWAEAKVPDGNVNRSIEAHLANYGVDLEPGEGSPEDHPVDPDLARDTTLRLLRVEGTDGTPIAAWTCYANHPTTFPPANTTFSADFPGLAARLFARRFDADGTSSAPSTGTEFDANEASTGPPAGASTGTAPVTLHAAGALGDVITPYDEYGPYALAERTAGRVEAAMWKAWQDAGGDLTRDLPVGGRARLVEYDGQAVEPGTRVANRGIVGLPILNGGENGPTPFTVLGLEGVRRPGWLADRVHGRKLPLAPAPWSTDVEVQAVRVDDRLLVTVPGEPTTETARRMVRAVRTAAGDDIADVTVVGVANGYNGYVTTPEEYDRQHYEGAHTVFGKYTSLLVQRTQTELAASLAEGLGAAPAAAGTRPAAPEAPVGGGSDAGRITSQPRDAVERMETVGIEWTGGPAGRDRPVGEPFLVLERAVDDHRAADGERGEGGVDQGTESEWEPVADDLGLGLVWTERSGDYAARYDVPPDLPTGTYRLRVTAARYDLPSRTFEIVPSTGLAVRGAGVDGQDEDAPDGATRLVVLAQNPAPDPDENLRSRDRSPRGGTATVAANGAEYEATWDEDAGGWVATVPGVSAGDTVTVPEGALVDASGNRSGRSVELTVGEVADVEWPADMETGGGDPPGPFGFGRFPT